MGVKPDGFLSFPVCRSQYLKKLGINEQFRLPFGLGQAVKPILGKSSEDIGRKFWLRRGLDGAFRY